MSQRQLISCIGALLAMTFLGASLPRADARQATSSPPPIAQESAPQGILPIPDYTGDLWTRRFLLGDFDTGRTGLANKGFQFNIDWTQTVQSVVTGGREPGTEYGGTLDYNMSFDLSKMGVLPGALIELRGESRYGESVNGMAGPILPVSTDMQVPLTGDLDENLPFALTTLTYTQFLSPKFALFYGRFDTLDGDANEFASGRGTTQFQNLNLIFSPALLITVPYSTLGGGAMWLPSKHITVATSIFNTADSSTTSGFDHIGDGWTWSTEAHFQYRLGHLPGGMNVGGVFAWANDFKAIGRRFTFQPGEGISIPDEDDSWAVYWSGWQYLVADESADDAPMRLTNGVPDRKGFGLFARIGFADQDTNPFELTASGGVGGRGVIPGRENDVFGAGYFYNQVQSGRITSLLGAEDSAQGLECFYNIAITPAAGLTFDVQVLESVISEVDTSIVLGARLRILF